MLPRLTAALLLAAAAPTHADPITVSEETTVLTEPLRADGTVDYPAAVNATGHAIDPADNAAVILAALAIAVDPHAFGDDATRDAFLQHLGWPEADPGIVVTSPGDFPAWPPRFGDSPGVEPSVVPHLRAIDPDRATWIQENKPALDALRDALLNRSSFYAPWIYDAGDAKWWPETGPLQRTWENWTDLLRDRILLRLAQRDCEAAWLDERALEAGARFDVVGPPIEHFNTHQDLTPKTALILFALDPLLAEMQSVFAHRATDHPLVLPVWPRQIALDQWARWTHGNLAITSTTQYYSLGGYMESRTIVHLPARDFSDEHGFDEQAGPRVIDSIYAEQQSIADLPTVRQRAERANEVWERVISEYDAEAWADPTARLTVDFPPDQPLPAGAADRLAEYSLSYVAIHLLDWMDEQDAETARCRLLAAACAQQRYFLNAGVYAECWAELIETGYLETIPIDPFGNGEPIRIIVPPDRGSCVLYSIDADLQDDGGRPPSPWHLFDDTGTTHESADLVITLNP